MRLGSLMLIFVATLFGSAYWYAESSTVCRAPVHYRIGDIDSRFNTTSKELIALAMEAEALWEAPLAQELFVYDEDPSSLPINLVFDERQAKADLETEIKEDLDAKQGMSESVATQYESLIAEFRTLKKKYEARVVTYEKKLGEYNVEVADWNSKGGAPQSEIEKLQVQEKELIKEQEILEVQAKKLNTLASQLNDIGARGNSLITDYNKIVEKYNDQFSEAHEFTQGENTQEAINIYQFNSSDELTLVLAHEFGHSLSLDHVENETSIMYHLMGAQKIDKGITNEDRTEFERVCTEGGFVAKMLRFVRSLV